ncbi:cupin domain-containing protein [Corallincola spongiicola]|nr:cupin domain-containing protein [Corallincola spongiicola]
MLLLVHHQTANGRGNANMQINADFQTSVFISADDMVWSKSPMAGVHRAMLDRIGDEQARATSLVRYAPASKFNRHQHPAGEEILVLEGDFNDEHGHYRAGTYLRNPNGTTHAPFSIDGCLLLVKLRQFQPADQVQTQINTRTAHWQAVDDNIVSLLLHHHGEERVQLLEIQAGTKLPISPEKGGHELLLISGSIEHRDRKLPLHSWLRFASHERDEFLTTELTKLYWKSGHLPPR